MEMPSFLGGPSAVLCSSGAKDSKGAKWQPKKTKKDLQLSLKKQHLDTALLAVQDCQPKIYAKTQNEARKQSKQINKMLGELMHSLLDLLKETIPRISNGCT